MSEYVPHFFQPEWPRTWDHVINKMPEHERGIFRQQEEMEIAKYSGKLEDLCRNCHIRPQFAKTYRVWRRDFRKTIEKATTCMNQSHSEYSREFYAAVIDRTNVISLITLSRSADHFRSRWREPIDNWAGKEGSHLDKAGCCVLVAFAAAALSAPALYYLC